MLEHLLNNVSINMLTIILRHQQRHILYRRQQKYINMKKHNLCPHGWFLQACMWSQIVFTISSNIVINCSTPENYAKDKIHPHSIKLPSSSVYTLVNSRSNNDNLFMNLSLCIRLWCFLILQSLATPKHSGKHGIYFRRYHYSLTLCTV